MQHTSLPGRNTTGRTGDRGIINAEKVHLKYYD
jgi:hypothetical protein